MRGTLRVKRDDWTDCYVVVHTAEGQPRKSVVIKGRLNVNRAVDGDVVAVELLPEVETEREKQSERLLDAMEQAERGHRNGARGSTQAGVESSANWGISMETAEATPDAIEGIEGAVAASTDETTATAGSSSSSSTTKASGSTQVQLQPHRVLPSHYPPLILPPNYYSMNTLQQSSIHCRVVGIIISIFHTPLLKYS